MKRQLLFLVLAFVLAVMTAPNASAGKPVPGYCGNNYAMLMTGYEPNQLPASGTGALGIGPGGFNGALTAIVGVGVIQFSSDCSTIKGELIYNDGDLQFRDDGPMGTPGVGVSGGPAACYSAEQETILPFGGLLCFDGGNHFTAGSVTTAGAPPGLSLLQFTANFGFYNGSVGSPAGSVPFAFNIQETNGDTTLVGNTVPSPTAPVLSLTMQEQLPGTVQTSFGKPPYLGSSAITCSGQGANEDDIVAALESLITGGVPGSYGTAVGSVNISPNGQATGILSFNSNDNLLVSTSSATPPNNSACAFSEQLDPFDGPAAFADGTSNLFSTITSPSTDPTCTNAALTDAGFTTSEVAWGSPGDRNAYAITTGLTESAFPFIPPGEMSTCTHLAD